MTTRPEAAYIALHAQLAAHAGDGTPLPAPHRNAALVDEFDRLVTGQTAEAWLNCLDDNADPVADLAGDAFGEKEFYQRAQIEFLVRLKDDDRRNAVFDAGLEAIRDALLSDTTLGGVIDDLEIDLPQRAGLALAGAPRIKAIMIPVRLLITAPTYLG